MKKANSFFFLAQVNDHILADFTHDVGISRITFKHQNAEDLNSLVLAVEKKGDSKSYVLHYKIVLAGKAFATAKSDLIPATDLYGVIAALANEIITQ